MDWDYCRELYVNTLIAYDESTGHLFGMCRPPHLKIPGVPKMAHAALSRQAIDVPNVSKLT